MKGPFKPRQICQLPSSVTARRPDVPAPVDSTTDELEYPVFDHSGLDPKDRPARRKAVTEFFKWGLGECLLSINSLVLTSCCRNLW